MAAVSKSVFESLVAEFYANDFPEKLWSNRIESEVVHHLKEANWAIENGRKPSKSQLYFCMYYDVLCVDGITRVVAKKGRRDGSLRVMLPKEEFFGVINSYHEKMGHVGLAKLSFAVRQRYVVPKQIISLFVNCCSMCSRPQHNTERNDCENNCSTGCTGKNWGLLQVKDQKQLFKIPQSGEKKDGAGHNISKITMSQGNASFCGDKCEL